MAITETTYKLDKHNRILEVSSSWDRFASENMGHRAAASEVIGHSLREYISGDSTQMWVMSLISSARVSNKSITKFYRCDSPDEKRYMKMTIWPEGEGNVSVSNKLLRVEKMRRTVTISYDNKSTIKRCSICNKIYVEHLWLEPDDAIVLGYLSEEDDLKVIYSVCNTCGTTQASQ